jgi:RecB family exonuclease
VKCPRRYLFERLLKLAEPDDPELILSLQPDKRGSLFHDVLMKALGPGGDEAHLRELLEDKYLALAADNQTGGGVLDEVERDRLIDWAQSMATFATEQSAGFTVEATEVDLSRLDAAVDVGGRRIRLHARLDRIDADPAHNRRIVDYKTGKAKNALVEKKLKDNDFNHGSTLQVPLYLLAYASVHHKQAVAAVEAAYWYMKTKDGNIEPNAVVFNSAFANEKQAILKEVLRDAVEGIEGGRFTPRPDVAGAKDNNYCRHCSFKVICDAQSRAYLSVRGLKTNCCPWAAKVGRIDDEK